MDNYGSLSYNLSMLDFIMAHLPWLWLAMAILMTILEFIIPGLATIWFALGALVMIPLSLLPIQFAVQIVIFLVISVVLLIFTRPFAVKKLKANREKTNVDALAGKSALVIKPISKYEKGEVKIGGIVWTARSEDEAPLKKARNASLFGLKAQLPLLAKKCRRKTKSNSFRDAPCILCGYAS